MSFLIIICCRAEGKPVGSPPILMFTILMFSFQYTSHLLNVVPDPLWLSGILFGKIQFFKLTFLMYNIQEGRACLSLEIKFSLTSAYWSHQWVSVITMLIHSLFLLFWFYFTKMSALCKWNFCPLLLGARYLLNKCKYIAGCCMLRYIHNFLFIQRMDHNPLSHPL